jgi:hypothetical protein
MCLCLLLLLPLLLLLLSCVASGTTTCMRWWATLTCPSRPATSPWPSAPAPMHAAHTGSRPSSTWKTHSRCASMSAACVPPELAPVCWRLCSSEVACACGPMCIAPRCIPCILLTPAVRTCLPPLHMFPLQRLQPACQQIGTIHAHLRAATAASLFLPCPHPHPPPPPPTLPHPVAHTALVSRSYGLTTARSHYGSLTS